MATEEPTPNKGTEIFRPYARLISILGDQLITSKWVGIIELVKNCYDADATEVSVRFMNFDVEGQAIIEIEDNGEGMTLDTILNVWMKPATPYKLNQKKSKEHRYTGKGRVMQGDKGVGRFAVYKLGNFVEIFTKTTNTPEVHLTLNFRHYAQNDEFAVKEKVPEKFLDQIQNQWEVNKTPVCITNRRKGTLIRISDSRNHWKEEELAKLQVAFQRMIPPTIPTLKEKLVADFDVKLYWNDNEYPKSRVSFEEVIEVAPFKFEGAINARGILNFKYRHNKNKEVEGELDLFDAADAAKNDLWGFPMFREQFLEFVKTKEQRTVQIKKADGSTYRRNRFWRLRRRPTVGPAQFFFYAFDWKDQQLDLKDFERTFIKNNSVYLYRDFTRVYPYGEKGIDWLYLSKLRAEDRAGRYFSYNDLLGFIFITQQNNPLLRDSASREGLVNISGASDDFVALIQTTLKVMKDLVDVDKRRDEIKKERVFTSASKKFTDTFERFQKQLIKSHEEETLKKAKVFFSATNELVEQYKIKVSITEELAGLGMAVEKSSHDIFMLIQKMIQNANDIVSRFDKGKLSAAGLKQFFADLIENLDFLYQELQILQPLFRESRKETKAVSVRETLERIQRYYRREFQFDISFKIEGSQDIVVQTNLGLMLQVFINLVDNSIYWLKKKPGRHKILVKIDETNRQVLVADNGPGIDPDLSEIVFLEFFSKKAESGRGLGLYIARELLDRVNAQISLITTEPLKILPGANFLIQFDKEE
jgi:signal transduction histidine kinase